MGTTPSELLYSSKWLTSYWRW